MPALACRRCGSGCSSSATTSSSSTSPTTTSAARWGAALCCAAPRCACTKAGSGWLPASSPCLPGSPAWCWVAGLDPAHGPAVRRRLCAVPAPPRPDALRLHRADRAAGARPAPRPGLARRAGLQPPLHAGKRGIACAGGCGARTRRSTGGGVEILPARARHLRMRPFPCGWPACCRSARSCCCCMSRSRAQTAAAPTA